MSPFLKKQFDHRIQLAKENLKKQYYEEAFRYLEEAHVLGQTYVVGHTVAHYWMLVLALRQRNFTHVVGQLLRLPLGILGSSVGVVPTGNTGGSNVKALIKMPIPRHLQEILDQEQDT